MIKFFRRIRKNLLTENLSEHTPSARAGRFGKYLIYAIGEIVLVVIGILIALQINNWNENRKLNVQERKMLNELLVNLRLDSADHQANLDFYRDVSQSAEYVFQTLESRAVWNDTMETHYGYLLRHGLATFNTSAYDNLRSVGFNLISNDSIRVALTNLHSITYTQILKLEQELSVDNQTFLIAPVILKRVRMYEPWFRGEPHDYIALMDDREFLEVVQWKATTTDYVADIYQTALRRTANIIELIEHDLKKMTSDD